MATKPGTRRMEKRAAKKAKKKRASIKNMLRSNERALAKTTDPGAKAALQAAREKLLKQQHEVKKLKLEEKYARKYGKVRFFERKRIMKARRKLNREIEAQGWANKEQREKLKQLDADAEYVQFFPKSEKYVSLFVTEGDQVHAEAERTRLRALIKAQRAQEALLTEKDEGGFTAADLAPADEDDDGGIEDDEFFAEEGEHGNNGGSHRADIHTPKSASKSRAQGSHEPPFTHASGGSTPGGSAGVKSPSRREVKANRREERRAGKQSYSAGFAGRVAKQQYLPASERKRQRKLKLREAVKAAGFGAGSMVTNADGMPMTSKQRHLLKKAARKAALKNIKQEHKPKRTRAEGGRKRSKGRGKAKDGSA